jgi:ADP-ribose pyrophosphatase YjhB (NUDIX family)
VISEEIYFCSQCGTHLTRAIRFGRLRPVCPSCDWVYFADPKVAAATLIERDNTVLLVRRANVPAQGLWTLPAGFIDAGEDPIEAAERECFEETGLNVRVTGLLDVLSGQEHPRGAHIVIFYRAEVLSGILSPGDDVDRASFFSRDQLPPLAFTTTQRILNMTV